MSNYTILNSANFNTINFNYFGSIDYSSEEYGNFNLSSITLDDLAYDPISMTISNGVFCLITNNYKHTDIFDEIIDGSGRPHSFSTTISKNNIFWEISGTNLTTVYNPTTLSENNFFYINILSDSTCKISLSNSEGTYYLRYTGSNLIFTQTESQATEFIYSYNNNSNQIIIIVEGIGAIYYDDDGNISSPSSNGEFTIFNVINKGRLNEDTQIEESFVPKYTYKNAIDQKYTLDNMFMLTHNYESNYSDNSNLTILKSNLSYDSNYSLVNYDNNMVFRKYTSVNTGIRGDTGYSNYILNYNSSDYIFTFIPDKQTYFNVPFELRGYSQININDTDLIKNGSIGGNSPLNSDKIYKKLYEYSDTHNTGVTPNVDNSKFLCSWLYYNPFNPSDSIWLDRYYNPDTVTQLDALSIEAWGNISDLLSFSRNNGVSEETYLDYYNEFNRTIGVFDVESKLTFEPNSLYMYERIGQTSSRSIHNELSSYIVGGLSSQVMDFDNNSIILSDGSGDYNEFTISLVLKDFIIDNFKGEKVFGNNDISLTIDRNYSPYIISLGGNFIRYYDIYYNLITSLEFDTKVIKIIPTEDYNRFYVQCDGNYIYTVENLSFISNVTNALTSYSINDIVYENGLLYILQPTGTVMSLDVLTDDIVNVDIVDGGDNILLVKNDTILGFDGDKVDYDESYRPYLVNGDTVQYNNITTPLLSSSDANFIDIYVDKDNISYVIKNDSIHMIDNTTLPKTIKTINFEDSEFVSGDLNLINIYPVRYIKDGNILEYIDVVRINSGGDYDETTIDKIYRYNKSLELVDTIDVELTNPELLQSRSNLFHTKYNEKAFVWNFTLYHIFNTHETYELSLEIDSSIIEESDTCVLNAVLNNKYGNISIYCNGRLVKIFKFDNEKYHFSNILQNKNIFVGASYFDGESTIDSTVVDSTNDMISGNYTIESLNIYNIAFSYYDAINLNRIYQSVDNSHLILPIKTRTYVEEISGFFMQNKHMRKSEYGSIVIKGTELTADMKTDVVEKIDQVFDDTFINLNISNTEIE